MPLNVRRLKRPYKIKTKRQFRNKVSRSIIQVLLIRYSAIEFNNKIKGNIRVGSAASGIMQLLMHAASNQARYQIGSRKNLCKLGSLFMSTDIRNQTL